MQRRELPAGDLWVFEWVHFQQDTRGRDLELRFFRDVDRREVDFVVTEGLRPMLFVECKLADRDIAPRLALPEGEVSRPGGRADRLSRAPRLPNARWGSRPARGALFGHLGVNAMRRRGW